MLPTSGVEVKVESVSSFRHINSFNSDHGSVPFNNAEFYSHSKDTGGGNPLQMLLRKVF